MFGHPFHAVRQAGIGGEPPVYLVAIKPERQANHARRPCILRVVRPLQRRPAGLFGSKIRQIDRKSVVEGKSVSVRVDLGGRRIIKKKRKLHKTTRNKKK